MKKGIVCFVLALVLGISFVASSFAETVYPKYDPQGGSSTKSFSNAHVKHKYITSSITKRSSNEYGSYAWDRDVSVKVSSVSIPAQTEFKITLVDPNGNAVGSNKPWSEPGTKKLTLYSDRTNIPKIALELRNVYRKGEIVASGSFTGCYDLVG
jgi:hypothetical protein